jgi:hypothetical protein
MLGGLQLLLVAQESQFRRPDPWSRVLRPGNALRVGPDGIIGMWPERSYLPIRDKSVVHTYTHQLG